MYIRKRIVCHFWFCFFAIAIVLVMTLMFLLLLLTATDPPPRLCAINTLPLRQMVKHLLVEE